MVDGVLRPGGERNGNRSTCYTLEIWDAEPEDQTENSVRTTHMKGARGAEPCPPPPTPCSVPQVS